MCRYLFAERRAFPVAYMNKSIVSIVLLFMLGCESYREYDDNVPRKNCASDKGNRSIICDIRLRLYSEDRWVSHSFLVIEKYSRNDLKKTGYQLILRLSLNNAADFQTAVFSIDGRTLALKPTKVIHDEGYGFRELVYFDIGTEFIKTLADGKDISLLMIGNVIKKYYVDEDDVPSIQEFYQGL